MVYIKRNNKEYGPYDDAALVDYVNRGVVVLQDVIYNPVDGFTSTVAAYLRKNRLRYRVQHAGGLTSQLHKIGGELILPKESMTDRKWLSDKRLLMLAVVGLAPSLLLVLPLGEVGVFYFIALYFSVIWGLFFYYLFKTPQVTLKTTVSVFFLSQIFVFVVWGILGLVRFNPFYALIESPFPLDLLGFVLGVGLMEESAKIVPLLYLSRKAKEPLMPRTLVYYGLMSGIAFGVFEGVQYQLTVNAELAYTEAFYLNIARLTSLPFLHAIWCGIAGYFIAFACLYPKYRRSLYFLAVAIPATLHGLYDTFCNGFVLLALAVSFVGVFMLMAYLEKRVDYQSKLRS
jgi:RsiW-degrading membrane proteinase PrsW (M82 family)